MNCNFKRDDPIEDDAEPVVPGDAVYIMWTTDQLVPTADDIPCRVAVPDTKGIIDKVRVVNCKYSINIYVFPNQLIKLTGEEEMYAKLMGKL